MVGLPVCEKATADGQANALLFVSVVRSRQAEESAE